MEGQRRERILWTALKLFGEWGYADVSMRDVAGAMRISVGNLTYYFQHKQDLIEALIFAQAEAFALPEPAESLASLDAFFRRMVAHQSAHFYYLRHCAQLKKLCPRAYRVQVKLLEGMARWLLRSCASLEEAGMLRPEPFHLQREGMIRALMCAYIFAPSQLEQEQDCAQEMLGSMWSVFYPSLSKRGRLEFRTSFGRRP